MPDAQSKRLRYGEYSILIIIAIIGLSGVIFFSNIFTFTLDFYFGMFLAGYGIFTIAFAFYYKAYIKREDNMMMFLWGYILTALGLALFFNLYTKNLLLNLSLAILFGAFLGFLTLRKTK